MRLTSDEIAAITECARAHFGEGAVVRLFGSRVRDDLRGGDIDLHVTTDRDGVLSATDFRRAIEERLAEDVDVHVIDDSKRRRPIDQIAILTGQVLAGAPILLPPELDPDTRIRIMREAYREMISDAIVSGHRTRQRLAEVLDDLRPKLPLDEGSVRNLSRLELLLVDSLLLQYSNLVATVQDQLIRALLLAIEGALPSRQREEQRERAQALGMLPADIDFKAIAAARNAVAHNYPGQPAKQASAINEVVAAVPLALRAFDSLAHYAKVEGLTLPPSA